MLFLLKITGVFLLKVVTREKATSYHPISYHLISYHPISYHPISYHPISYHLISYHINAHVQQCYACALIWESQLLKGWVVLLWLDKFYQNKLRDPGNVEKKYARWNKEFLCSTWYLSHEWAQRTREISGWTREEKLHISKHLPIKKSTSFTFQIENALLFIYGANN